MSRGLLAFACGVLVTLALGVASVIGIELRISRANPGLLRIDVRGVLVLPIGALPAALPCHEALLFRVAFPNNVRTARRVPRPSMP